jgi:hypothetical protein
MRVERERLTWALRQTLTSEQWELFRLADRMDEETRGEQQSHFVDRFAAYFPDLAPTIGGMALDLFESELPPLPASIVHSPTCDIELDRGTASDEVSDRLRVELTPDQWAICVRISTLDSEFRLAELDAFVDRVCERFSGFAPAIRLVAEHVLESQMDPVQPCPVSS